MNFKTTMMCMSGFEPGCNIFYFLQSSDTTQGKFAKYFLFLLVVQLALQLFYVVLWERKI